MIKLYCKKKLSNQTSISSHSTVTKSLSREDFSKRKVNLLFDIDIMETNLNFYPKYNSHQTYLFNKSYEFIFNISFYTSTQFTVKVRLEKTELTEVLILK